MPLTLFERFVCERDLETEQNCNILTRSLMAISVVSFSFSRAAQPGIWGPASLGHVLIPASYRLVWSPNSTGGPKGPFSRVVAFSTTSFLQLLWLQLTDFLSSPSYMIVQSPVQSLVWHVWSSSSGNNCHAVHWSLSFGASVYECTMGFLPCPIFSAKPAYAISSHNCHRSVSLPSGASLWNGMFDRVEGQYTTVARIFICYRSAEIAVGKHLCKPYFHSV